MPFSHSYRAFQLILKCFFFLSNTAANPGFLNGCFVFTNSLRVRASVSVHDWRGGVLHQHTSDPLLHGVRLKVRGGSRALQVIVVITVSLWRICAHLLHIWLLWLFPKVLRYYFQLKREKKKSPNAPCRFQFSGSVTAQTFFPVINNSEVSHLHQ